MSSFAIGFFLFALDLGVLFLVAKKLIKKESKNTIMIFLALKFLILFSLLWIIITVVKPQVLLFILGAVFALLLVSFILFLLNKNN